MNTNGVIAAIQRGHAIRVEHGRRWGQLPKIVLSVDGQTIGAVNYWDDAPPTVIAQADMVRVRPSKGIRRGFTLKCESTDEASFIAQTLLIAIQSQSNASLPIHAD